MSSGGATIEELKLNLLYFLKNSFNAISSKQVNNFTHPCIILKDSSINLEKVFRDLGDTRWDKVNIICKLYDPHLNINDLSLLLPVPVITVKHFKESVIFSSRHIMPAFGSAINTQFCIDVGINIKELIENDIIIRYIDEKDIDEAIFNTRMAIYNLTHIGALKNSKSKGHEECCDKLESRLDRLKINLSRVEGMVREIEVPRNTTLRVSPNRPRYYFSAPYLNSPRQSSSRPNSQTRRKPRPQSP